MCRIVLRGLRKDFGATTILRDIDLEIREQEFCVFIGPSGCGKSTLLRLIAGLEDASAGEIEIDGRLVNDVPPAQRNVAMVFQSYALYPHMSTYENMAFGLRHLKIAAPEIDRRVRTAAGILQLEDLLERKPRQLSGGQRQRVAIGRAIVRQPKVFLFDEPLSNLDAALRVATRVEIARLHRELSGASMVYVTHDQTEAMTLADRIVLLRPGVGASGEPSIAQVGTPLELYHRPAHRFVAEFIGSPSMNFFDGRVAATGTRRIDVLAAGMVCAADVQGESLAVGDPVAIGIRPEHVEVGATSAASVEARVTHVEHLGEHSYVYGALGAGQTVLAKTVRDDIVVGDRLPIGFPPHALHVFRGDGRALPRLLKDS